jgi:hypothetical protein
VATRSVNLWECTEPGCKNIALGEGGALGLRAIGWYFVVGEALKCPAHRPDGTLEHNTRFCDVEPGQPCSECQAEQEAARLQQMIGITLGVRWHSPGYIHQPTSERAQIAASKFLAAHADARRPMIAELKQIIAEWEAALDEQADST